MTWNGQFHPICNFSNLFPPKWLRMTQNGQFCPIHNFSNLFPPKWLRMTWNGQFCPICNFSNLFPLKWLRMTWYAPHPRNGKVEISGQCDILVLADVPPTPRIEINMNAIENNWGQQVHFTNLPPPPLHCIHTSLVCGIH